MGCGLWRDFTPIDDIHQLKAVSRPEPANVRVYRALLPAFRQARQELGRLGDTLAATSW